MSKRKPPARDWKNREIADWNATTFRVYLEEKHAEIFGIPYARRGPIAMEAAMIKRMIDEHGPETVKAFIDECFRRYRPTSRYPGVNFAFMKAYMGECLQRVIRGQARMTPEPDYTAPTSDVSADEMIDWL